MAYRLNRQRDQLFEHVLERNGTRFQFAFSRRWLARMGRCLWFLVCNGALVWAYEYNWCVGLVGSLMVFSVAQGALIPRIECPSSNLMIPIHLEYYQFTLGFSVLGGISSSMVYSLAVLSRSYEKGNGYGESSNVWHLLLGSDPRHTQVVSDGNTIFATGPR